MPSPRAISRRATSMSSGQEGGQRRSSSVSPAPDKILLTPSTRTSSPDWLAAASVSGAGGIVGAIEEPGLLVLVGGTPDDTPDQAARLDAKVWGLRILDGEKSCSDVNAPLLVISQFTLYADLAKGRRPSWSAAAPRPVAEPLVGAVVQALRDLGARVQTRVFGAAMKVALVNDGPVPLLLDLERPRSPDPRPAAPSYTRP